MNDFILMRPTAAYADQIRELRQEFLDAGSSMDGMGPLRRMEDPEAYIARCVRDEDPNQIPANRVPATQFLFIRKEDNRLVGMIQVRHYFNEHLAQYGGHIGYSVHPDERRKGYAKWMLAHVLPEAMKLGLNRVLVTCDEDNEASRRTILKNGGVFDRNTWLEDEKQTVSRYWIDL